MKLTTVALMTFGLIFLLICYLYWPQESLSDRFDRVKSAKIEISKLTILTPDRTETSSIDSQTAGPHFINVSGEFHDVGKNDFDELAIPNQLFSLTINDDRGSIWKSSPAKISMTNDTQFQFECPVMVPKTTAAGSYEMEVSYYFQSIKTAPVRIAN